MTDHEPGTEFRCGECGNSVTVGSNGIEYGHARGVTGKNERCSRRPDAVDTVQNAPDHDGFCGPERWVS